MPRLEFRPEIEQHLEVGGYGPPAFVVVRLRFDEFVADDRYARLQRVIARNERVVSLDFGAVLSIGRWHRGRKTAHAVDGLLVQPLQFVLEFLGSAGGRTQVFKFLPGRVALCFEGPEFRGQTLQAFGGVFLVRKVVLLPAVLDLGFAFGV